MIQPASSARFEKLSVRVGQYTGIAVAVAAGFALAGCQEVGPNSIRQGNLRYNAAIADTQKQEVFMNLVRVHDDQPTYFMDIIEVDATVTAAASVTANTTGMTTNEEKIPPNNKNGAMASFGGTVGGTLTYSESPLIRYQPLQGSALIQQIVAPITVDSVAYLFDSEWPLSSIMAFTVDRLTPGYEMSASSFGALAELYDYGALTIAAGHADPPGGQTGTGRGKAAKAAEAKPTPPSGPDDTLFVYLQINNPSLHGNATTLEAKKNILLLWARLLQIYQGTQPANLKVPLADFVTAVGAIHDEPGFAKVYAMLPNNRIELRTTPLAALAAGAKSAIQNSAPILRLRSALGSLRWSIQQYPPYIDFIDQATFARVRSHCWNQGTKDFYVLDPGDENDVTASIANDTVKAAVSNYLRGMQTYNRIQCQPSYLKGDYNTNTVNYHEDLSNIQDIQIEKELNELRRYILVITAAAEPAGAFVSWYDDVHSQWDYIAADDVISQRNFNLLMQLLVMQAVAPSPALNPSINVGGGRGG
jgi:hypothetical protein